MPKLHKIAEMRQSKSEPEDKRANHQPDKPNTTPTKRAAQQTQQNNIPTNQSLAFAQGVRLRPTNHMKESVGLKYDL